MKVAILCLFALVAVSQAAFTANLKQRASPVLARTFAQARMQLRVRSDSELQTTLFQTLQQHAEDLMNQISSGISSGVDSVTGIYNELTDTLAQLQALGGNAVDAATEILGNLWSSIFGRQKALDLGVVSQVLQGLGLDQILGSLFQHVVSLVSQLEIPAFIESALSSILSNDVVQAVLGQLFGRQRGLFGDILSGLTAAGQQLAAQIAGIVAQIQDTLAAGLSTVAEMATQIIAEAQTQVMTITQDVANQLITELAPLASQMNGLYEQAVAAIQSLVGNKRF